MFLRESRAIVTRVKKCSHIYSINKTVGLISPITYNIYICQDGGAVGFFDFTKLLFTLSSLAQPFNRVRSTPEDFFIILGQRKACAGQFREDTAGKRTGLITRWLEATVHPARNHLCYQFSLYQTNESCSQSVSQRNMLLIRFNKSCLRITAPNVTESEWLFYERSQR